MIIYCITNRINDKKYIGQTIGSLRKRWIQHQSSARTDKNFPLYNAIRKYGADNFTVEQIDIAATQKELDQKEIYWGTKLNALSPEGYSLRFGQGKGIISDETRKKISISKMGHKTWLGRHLSSEHKLKISKSKKEISNGERNPAHKLTEQQVVEIRRKYVPFKYSLKNLAREYGVAFSTIHWIVTGASWKGVS